MSKISLASPARGHPGAEILCVIEGRLAYRLHGGPFVALAQ